MLVVLVLVFMTFSNSHVFQFIFICSLYAIHIHITTLRFQNLACFRALEIAFVVDTSYSVSDEELHRMKDFMKEVANGFSISETGARFSIVTYNKHVRVLLKFKDNFDAEKIFAQLENVDKTRNGERRLDLALEKVRSDVFALKAGVRQVGFVFTGYDRVFDAGSDIKNPSCRNTLIQRP